MLIDPSYNEYRTLSYEEILRRRKVKAKNLGERVKQFIAELEKDKLKEKDKNEILKLLQP